MKYRDEPHSPGTNRSEKTETTTLQQTFLLTGLTGQPQLQMSVDGVIRAVQSLYSKNLSLQHVKDSLANLSFHLHETERRKIELELYTVSEELTDLHALFLFLQEITAPENCFVNPQNTVRHD